MDRYQAMFARLAEKTKAHLFLLSPLAIRTQSNL